MGPRRRRTRGGTRQHDLLRRGNLVRVLRLDTDASPQCVVCEVWADGAAHQLSLPHRRLRVTPKRQRRRVEQQVPGIAPAPGAAHLSRPPPPARTPTQVVAWLAREQRKETRGRSKQSGAVIGSGVSVRPSTLPGAGRGLFADQLFLPGDVVTAYAGRVISDAEARGLPARRTTHAMTLLSHFLVVDGLREPQEGAGGGRFLNDPRYMDPDVNNAAFERVEDAAMGCVRVVVVARHAVGRGAEVFAAYGAGWWGRQG